MTNGYTKWAFIHMFCIRALVGLVHGPSCLLRFLGALRLGSNQPNSFLLHSYLLSYTYNANLLDYPFKYPISIIRNYPEV
jgi:hypothetical protein